MKRIQKNSAGMRWCLTAVAMILALLAVPAARLQAQSFYGSIVGTVTDTSGAAVPGATVTVTNTGTNEVRTMKSDATGGFNFVNLVPASYKLDIQAANFKRFVRSPIEVQVGSMPRIDAALAIGAATETVEVTTQTPLLQTESGQMGQQVEGKTVQEMPLNGRNVMNLIALTAGVVPQGASLNSTAANQNSGNTNSQGWGNYQIGGGMANQSAAYVDGVAINVLGNTMALVPTQDAIQEFSVASNSVSADFGRFSGGVVNMTTKSGTNKFHGTAYEYNRNTDFNANDWFNKKSQKTAGTPNTPLKFLENQFGAGASGPIWKDKAFFMGTWEQAIIRFAQYSSVNVPTTDMVAGKIPYQAAKSGVTTNVTDGTNQIVNVFDPLTVQYDASHNPIPNSSCIKQSASGNYWDTSTCTLSAAAKQMVQYFPAVSATSYGYNGAGKPYGTYGVTNNYNYIVNVPVGNDQKQYNARMDANLSSRQRIFGRYTYWHLGDISWMQFPTVTKYITGNGSTINTTNQVVLGDTYTINPTTILDVRVSWTRQHYDTSRPQTTVDESAFFPGASFLTSEMAHLPPQFGLNGQRSFSYGWFRGPFNKTALSNYQLSANVTKILGKHSVKIGTEFRMMEADNTGNLASGSGNFSFTGNSSKANFSGDEWADFLLGDVSNASLSTVSSVAAFNYYKAFYVQDSWTYNSKLTMNIGLRYEMPGSIGEKHDKLLELLPNVVDPYTGITGTLGLVNSSLYGPRTIQKPPVGLIAPRLGFAYRAMSNMVIRGGYGIAYLPPDMFAAGNAGPASSSVNSATTSLANDTLGLAPGNASYVSMANPFPTGLLLPTGRTDPTFMTKRLWTQAITAAKSTSSYPYNQQWNLSISRQMKGDWMIDVGYAGAKGTHLPAIAGGMDQLPRQYWSQGSALTLAANNVTKTTPLGGYSKTVSLGQSLRPYPFYSNFYDANPYWGGVVYHALQAKVEKRFRSGGVLMSSYTWAKMIGDTDSMNTNLEPKASSSSNGTGYGNIQDMDNHKAERSVLSFNVPSRLVVSYVLPLPFGKGQKYLNNTNGIMERVVSGWAFNGITSFQSGFALSVAENTGNNLGGTTGNYGTLGAGSLRSESVAGCAKTISGTTRARINGWFNTACFVAPGTAAGTVGWALGNEPRVDNQIHSEGVDNWDFSLMKSTRIWETTSLEFRGEFFNVFNRTQFAPPIMTRGASNFGTIQSQINAPRLVQLSLRLKF